MSEQDAEVVVDNDTTALDAEPSQILDEDRMEVDPLEDGMDGAEGYSRDVRLGGTREAEEQDTLAYRLPQEEPDVVAETPPDVPIAARPATDLDDSVDDPANSVDGVGGGGVTDALAADGSTPDERLTDGGGEVELGLSSADGMNTTGGMATDSRVGEVAEVDNEDGTEGAEQQALRIDQES